MSVQPGTRLGPYEVLSSIGSGGMGEVYRAHDTRLDRDVAIKVLPDAFADDPERRSRFEREAKAIAALSHPNILAIHDIGESTLTDPSTGQPRSFLYAVTELLDGETLRDRLKHGALPVRKAVETGVQIARGLAAAHDRGIVHRDLKPENVFLLADGHVKILDFGLAKSMSDAAAVVSDATATAGVMTDPGTVLGTVGYMAPEQVRGQTTDARSDLFAFGAVLYETLSGQRAFRRDTAAETMTAILREDPTDLSTSHPNIPPALDRIVRHCLEKQPTERFQTARDVAFALEAFSGTTISSSKVAALPDRHRRLSPVLLAAVFTIAGVAAGFAIAAAMRPAAIKDEITFNTRTWDSQWITNTRFAPDGQTIVYSAAPSGNVPSLFVLRKDSFVPQRIGPLGTHLLSVSKNGDLLVIANTRYFNHRLFSGALSQMTMDGAGKEVAHDVLEADWAPDSKSMAVSRFDGNGMKIEYPVGTKLYGVTKGYLSDLRVSPDGDKVAFLEHPTFWDDRGFLKIVDRKGAVKTLGGDFWGAEGLAWTPDGKQIFVSVSVTAGFDYAPYAVNVNGTPVMRKLFPSNTSTELMDVAPDGRVLLDFNDVRGSTRVLRPDETTERELPWLDMAFPSQLSDDGQYVLFTDQSESAGLHYKASWRKTDGSSPPVWLGDGAALLVSPDSKWVLARINDPERYVAYPTGAGQPINLDFSPVLNAGSFAFFPDGRLFFCGAEADKKPRCYARSLAGGPPSPVTPENVVGGAVAPDGHTIGIGFVDGGFALYDTTTHNITPVAAKNLGDARPIGWSTDSRSVFVAFGSQLPLPIERVDLYTGKRTPMFSLMPPDRAGVIRVYPANVSHDGRAYAYGYMRTTTKAVVVTGLK